MEKLTIKVSYNYSSELELEVKVDESVKNKIISDILRQLDTAMENIVIGV